MIISYIDVYMYSFCCLASFKHVQLTIKIVYLNFFLYVCIGTQFPYIHIHKDRVDTDRGGNRQLHQVHLN